MNTATELDHVGIAGHDLDALAAQWQALGFTLTPPARHAGRRTPDGPIEPFATGNRCIMLREGYIELIAILDPTRFSDGMDARLARYEGIHILALGMDDEAANLARMRRAGIDIPGIAWLERPVDDADPTGPQAKFARLPLAGAPEARMFLIRHLTREAIWQERFLTHANHAVALEATVIVSEQPAETAARLSRLAGHPVTPDPLGGFRLTLPRGSVRMLPPHAIPNLFPGATVPPPPFVAGIVLRTDDANAAAAAIPGAQSVEAGVMVPAALAGGSSVLFRPG